MLYATALGDELRTNLHKKCAHYWVKKTVNFDAPDVYHLYYGDESGTLGTVELGSDPDFL